MKYILIIMLVVITSMLSSCQEEPVECTELQIMVEEACVDLSGSEIQLLNALENTKEMDNYTLQINFFEDEIGKTPMEIRIDGSAASIQTTNHIEFITYNDGLCEIETYFLPTEENVTSSRTCTSNDQYSFFNEFTYSMFDLVLGKYELDTAFYFLLENIFIEDIENAVISDVKLSIENNYISEIDFSITIDDEVIQVEMNYSMFDETVVINSVGGR